MNVARSLEEAKTQLKSGKAVITDPEKEDQDENLQTSKNEESNTNDSNENEFGESNANEEKVGGPESG